MHDWNVIASVRDDKFREARALLERFDRVDKTKYFNVLVMKVADQQALLEFVYDWSADHPETNDILGHLIPFTETFHFHSPEDFEEKALELVKQFLPQLAGKKFHVRMHRRGFKGRLHATEEEQFLDGVLLQELERVGQTGEITFDDPDVIIAVQTINNRAGISCWSREELQRYPFLNLD